ncbi:hypothetical protein THAOC_16790 [Thalassiosira oceanica]|uniref:Uncharacterized protein n=1 Tax=Thalassiosira oceanica TaxID=159749 RepID=K0S8W2_THAOC|nr:hypothetical protein THAOC_16790 [Thalassiosira oceanica]|eukprot:EJK62593.1 hypothetical protein THAOC_16790 [Thalassiosira oceanica]
MLKLIRTRVFARSASRGTHETRNTTGPREKKCLAVGCPDSAVPSCGFRATGAIGAVGGFPTEDRPAATGPARSIVRRSVRPSSADVPRGARSLRPLALACDCLLCHPSRPSSRFLPAIAPRLFAGAVSSPPPSPTLPLPPRLNVSLAVHSVAPKARDLSHATWPLYLGAEGPATASRWGALRVGGSRSAPPERVALEDTDRGSKAAAGGEGTGLPAVLLLACPVPRLAMGDQDHRTSLGRDRSGGGGLGTPRKPLPRGVLVSFQHLHALLFFALHINFMQQQLRRQCMPVGNGIASVQNGQKSPCGLSCPLTVQSCSSLSSAVRCLQAFLCCLLWALWQSTIAVLELDGVWCLGILSAPPHTALLLHPHPSMNNIFQDILNNACPPFLLKSRATRSGVV